MAKKKLYKLVLAFEEKDAMLAFAAEAVPNAVIYHADALDKEFSGIVPPHAFVARKPGSKPDKFRAELERIGAAS